MKRRIRLIWMWLAAVLLLSACGKEEKTSEQIFKECAPGVVMVATQYYFSATVPGDNEPIYFTGGDEDALASSMTDNKSEIEKKQAVMFGTGFYVSKTGDIITNRHVVQPSVPKDEFQNLINSIVRMYAGVVDAHISDLESQISALQYRLSNASYPQYDYYGNYMGDTYTEDVNALQTQLNKLQSELSSAQTERLEIEQANVNNVKIQCHATVGICKNGAYVGSLKDFTKSDIVKVSDMENVDLALIKRWDKTTPADAYVFRFAGQQEPFADASFWEKCGMVMDNIFSKKEEPTLNIQDQVYMIGFNQGPELARTSNGLQAQITSGTISQMPDENRVMYTIPSLPGSSGSPVLNKYGEVVAVNFAGMLDTQSFNFGIPYKKVKAFAQ